MQRLSALAFLTVLITCALPAQWHQQKSGTAAEISDIVALSPTAAIAVARDGSILRTSDAGDTWTIVPLLPLFVHPWNAISFFSDSSGTVAGDFGHVATTTDGGDQWRWHGIPKGRNCLSVLQIGPGNIYVGDDSGWVHHSIDTGATWSSEQISKWPVLSLFAWRGTYVLGLPVYALTPYTLHTATEFPPSPWTETILQSFRGLGSQAFRGEFCEGGGPGFIVGVTGDFRAAPAIVRKSITDSTWTTIFSASAVDGTLHGVSAPSARIIYACGDRGMIFRSKDGGDTWSLAPVPTNAGLRSISFADESRGFAAGDSGTILHTTNGGLTWAEEEDPLPTEVALYQNYPNPFNPSTTIRYELPKSSDVRLSISDLFGREVSVLVNERKPAGVHEVRFDSSELSSGVYFYRLETGNFAQTRKLVFLK